MAADDVRNHLVKKLRKTIEKANEDSSKGVAALACCCPCLLSPKVQTLDNYLRNAADNKLSLDNLYRLHNLLDVWQSKKGSYSVDSFTFAFKFKSNLDKIIADVKATNNVEDKPGQAQASVSSEETGDPCWSDRSVNEKEIVGFAERAMSLQRFLTQKEDESQFQAIGLIGMRGIGKTTLCQMIFDKPELKRFVPRIWVCLSRRSNDDPDARKETVKRILVCLGVERTIIESADRNHGGLQGLLLTLRHQLAGKNYLIVLDDVWCPDKSYMTFCSSLAEDERNYGEKLAYGLPKGGGGTVLFTSRIDEVAKRMATAENLHRVRPLSDDNCWEIFRATVEREGKKMPDYLESLKERIKKRCAGLPLSAKWLGEIARENAEKSPGAATDNNLDDRSPGQLVPSAGTH
ncbi:probable disease resistance protein At5g45440 [Diospyros lotus]|uniref:probable disease resistance protein At5g45440 n=1 Tax=Diospyros lotus TaxID=55363 RepID=UPI0022570F12|nr:probable disease resistance protein At5g45440 [Diospyros lotus]